MAFTYDYTVRFRDTDAAGVVYFANVLNICHDAYEASLQASGINLQQFFTKPVVAFPIIHASVDFFRPIFCGDKLAIKLIPQKLGTNKFEINYEVFIDNIVVSKANTKQVCIDANSRRKLDFPKDIMSWLEFCCS